MYVGVVKRVWLSEHNTYKLPLLLYVTSSDNLVTALKY